MLSMQLSKRFVQQIVLDGFAFVGILNNLLDCYNFQGTVNLNRTFHIPTNGLFVCFWLSTNIILL